MTASRPLGRILDATTTFDSDRVALIVDDDVVVTYAELEEAVRRVADGLAGAGVRAGQRVPLADHTSVLATATVIACARMGAAAALMNPRLTGGEMSALVDAAGTGPVGVAGPIAAQALSEAGCATVLGADDLLGGGTGGHAGQRPVPETSASEDAVVLFTSGTTGTPKAVPLAQGQIGAAHRRLRTGAGPDAGRLPHVRALRARGRDARPHGGAGPGLDHHRPHPVRRRGLARGHRALPGQHLLPRAHHAAPHRRAPAAGRHRPELIAGAHLRRRPGLTRAHPHGSRSTARRGAGQHLRPDRDPWLDHHPPAR